MNLPVYDRRILRSVTSVFLALIMAALVLNAALALASAVWPNWLPRQFFGVDFIAENRQRVLAAERDYLRNPARLVTVFGLSSASEGIALKDVSSLLDGNTRLLGLAGGGRNLRDVERYALPLLDSELEPEFIVFALNLFHLMDPPMSADSVLTRIRATETVDDLRGGWLFSRRADLKYAGDALILHAHVLVSRFLGATIIDDRDPWRDMQRMGLVQSSGESDWRNNVARYGARGYYDAQNYVHSVRQGRILTRLIGMFASRDSKVIIVLMPEHSRLRALIPDAAEELLDGIVAAAGPAIDIVDMRQSVADSGFLDISHMNASGRREFSALLGAEIGQRLAASRAR